MPDRLERLRPEVAGHAAGAFVLAEDLVRLVQVHAIGAHEATILYGARILEALVAEALETIGVKPSTNVCSNLYQLDRLGLLTRKARYWGHALRRIGNEARHVGRRLGAAEADAASALAEGWLEWFFCRFAFGAGLEALTGDGSDLALASDERLRELLKALAAERIDGQALTELAKDGAGILSSTPAAAGIAAEILLERNAEDDAARVLEPALSRFPGDVRLVQLAGLLQSRAGRLDAALSHLEPLYRRFRDDEETAGIIAGVYKRQWQAAPEDPSALERSHGAYARGWERSAHANTYLGINAATTALWLGQSDDCGRIAGEVRVVLERLAAWLAQGRGGEALFGYWEQVTLAEARILVGDDDGARQTYRAAIDANVDAPANVQTTLRQLDGILDRLGISGGAEGFLSS